VEAELLFLDCVTLNVFNYHCNPNYKYHHG